MPRIHPQILVKTQKMTNILTQPPHLVPMLGDPEKRTRVGPTESGSVAKHLRLLVGDWFANARALRRPK